MIVDLQGKAKVEHAVAEAERKTTGEIVVVIAAASGTYFFVPLLWASLVALAFPWPLIYFTWEPVQTIYSAQLAVYAIVAVALAYRPVRFALAPKSLKRDAAHRRAVEQFLAQNVTRTPEHTGVLLFVSVAERYVEILADTAIHDKVPQDEWDGIISTLTEDIGKGAADDGLVRAVLRVGQHLAAHFPAKEHVNALPNHLILL